MSQQLWAGTYLRGRLVLTLTAENKITYLLTTEEEEVGGTIVFLPEKFSSADALVETVLAAVERKYAEQIMLKRDHFHETLH